MFEINTTDPSRNSYYYPILAGIFLFLIIMELLISVLKDKVDLNSSMNNTCLPNVSYSMTFIKNNMVLKYVI